MDYSKMSDFEINCEVLAVFNPDIKHMSLSGDNSCFYDCGPTGDGWNQIDIPDYCNNPADAWPIITENNISIILDNPTMPCATANARDLFDDEDPIVSVAYDKPLRAAMLVFLMMQEAK